MMDISAFESINSNSTTDAKVAGRFSGQFLVILTPTPLHVAQGSQIGFARIVTTREKLVLVMTELAIHRESAKPRP